MSVAIGVEQLGKRYKVTHDQCARYGTLRDSLANLVTVPLRRWRGEGTHAMEDFWALRDVSFEVKPGEVVGIIGHNGAGKSTLLKLLSKITKPTVGRIALRGRVGSLLEVGTGFHPELSGRENIYLNGSILGMSRQEIQRKFDAIVDFAEVERFLDTPVKRFSSGMYVRLAFAVAAHLEPEILIIDEVLAVGDIKFQEKCLRKLGEASRSSATILLVSHDMNSIARLAHRCLLLKAGTVEDVGPVASVIAKYLGAGDSGAAQWHRSPESKARGDVALDRIYVAMRDCEEPRAQFNANEPVDVAVEFTVRSATYAQIAFRLNNNTTGATVFTSALSDQSQDSATQFAPGKHVARCRVPAYFLRPGNYHVLFAANNPRGPQHDLVEKALNFEVTHIGSLDQFDRRLGAVVPMLDWSLS
jgi:lipopolysaccharide transport system ATP-binding protein